MSLRSEPRASLGWELALLVGPVLALTAFGFLSLRWERQAQEEEVRNRLERLVDPIRRTFYGQLATANLLTGAAWEDSPVRGLPPEPGEVGASLEKFEAGQFAEVLGGAGSFSEAGLPLRPLAAYRLMQKEKEPDRLAELSEAIASEPSIVTPRLLESAEARYRELGLPLPTVLSGWRERWRSERRVRALFAENSPEARSKGKQAHWLEDEEGELLLVRGPSGLLLVPEHLVRKAARETRTRLVPELPPRTSMTIAVQGKLEPPGYELARNAASYPPVAFSVADRGVLRRLTRRRQASFAVFLLVATAVSGIGVAVLRRTVLQTRELAERKGNLLAAVSHEMRTPVASIRLLAENLARDTVKTESERRSHLSRLVEQAERLSTLVANVLSYSRGENVPALRRAEPIDAVRLLEEVAEEFRVLAEDRKIRLRLLVTPLPDPPHGDRQSLRAAVSNLLDNALKHSPPGAEIACGTNVDETRSGWWRLWVEDQGAGVPLDERGRIFDAFYRVGSELRRETPGTGLGLALVKQVAEQHGGEVWCESGASGGARFVISLPMQPEGNQTGS